MDANDMPALRWDDIPDPSAVEIDAADADLLERRLAAHFGVRLTAHLDDLDAPGHSWVLDAPNPRDGQLCPVAYAALEGIPYIAHIRDIAPRCVTDEPAVTTWEDGQRSVRMLGGTMVAALWIALICGTGAWFIARPLLG